MRRRVKQKHRGLCEPIHISIDKIEQAYIYTCRGGLVPLDPAPHQVSSL